MPIAQHIFTIALLSSLCAATLARAGVAVRKSAPSIRHNVFDPAKPPPALPKLGDAEAAVTVCSFRFSAEPLYEVVGRQREADGSYSAEILVDHATLSVGMNVTVWIPKGASAKLKAHEEGHRKLDEMNYKKLTEPAAQAAGALLDGQRFTGHGPTAAKALANAVETAFRQAGQAYVAQTAKVNDEINAKYDALTEHGTNELPEADAIKQALDQYEHDHPATEPSK